MNKIYACKTLSGLLSVSRSDNLISPADIFKECLKYFKGITTKNELIDS